MRQVLFFSLFLFSCITVRAEVISSAIDSCATSSAIVNTPTFVSACAGDSVELSATLFANVTSQWYKDGQPFGPPNAEIKYASEGGQYHLEITNVLLQCNHSFDVITVQINPLPQVSVGADVTVCEGGYVEFYATGAIDYFWSDGVYHTDMYSTLLYTTEEISVIGINEFGCSNSDTLIATVSPSVTYFYDGDGDGFGNIYAPVALCYQPSGYVTNSDDCNDYYFTINPNASEICNVLDDNCNGLVDEGFVFGTYYQDSDSDGFGNVNVFINSCQLSGYVSNETDCDDDNAMINPNASETCNGQDENCNGLDDEGLVFMNYYIDLDLDGFGSLSAMQNACSQPLGFVANAFDCNDASFCVNAGATEVCNGMDDDCNGEIDNGIVFANFYTDADNDTYGDPATAQHLCLIPVGPYVTNGEDCDDTNALVNPASAEIPENGIDDDCNPNTSDVFVLEMGLEDLTIYPNPFSDQLTLSTTMMLGGNIEIYNAIGELIYSSRVLRNPENLDLSFLPSGYYVVRVGSVSRKITKR